MRAPPGSAPPNRLDTGDHDEHPNRSDRPGRRPVDTYTGVLNELRNVMDAVRAGVPETGGYGEIGRPAFAHGWNAAMEHVYGRLATAHALLRQVDDAIDDAPPAQP